MEYRDYYEVMGLKRDATQDDIKRAYRRLARKYHPDVSKESDAEKRFKELGEAYEVLKDPEKRAAYDQLGKNWKSGQDFRPPPDWDQGFEFHSNNINPEEAEAFSDFFESLFGQRTYSGDFGKNRQHEIHMRGQDTHAKVVIDLNDTYHGARKTLTLKHTELGTDGRPRIKERNLNVQIPKGIHQGQHIRLAGQGGAGYGKGEAGDLYLEVEIRENNLYKVEGKDVYIQLPIAPWEAALGTSLTIPTPSGKVKLKIPSNSESGHKLKLKGRGIPANQKGDLYAVLRIVLPPANTDAEKNAYNDFKNAFNFNPRINLGV